LTGGGDGHIGLVVHGAPFSGVGAGTGGFGLEPFSSEESFQNEGHIKATEATSMSSRTILHANALSRRD
jgi:hypothetical protein